MRKKAQKKSAQLSSVQTIIIKLEGKTPLLMASDRASDPLSNDAQWLSQISAKRKKTNEDFAELARREFLVALYTEAGKVIYPIDNVHACLYSAARKRKEGPVFMAGLRVSDVELHYDGPRNPNELWEIESFRDRRSVRVGQNKIFRTRPKFAEWRMTITALLDTEYADIFNLEEWVAIAGRQIGIGDYRPQKGGLFGTFEGTIQD